MGTCVWLQRIGLGHSFPWFLDSALCIGVILHGIFNSKPECNSLFSFPAILGKEVRLDFVYLLAGYFSYFFGLGSEPYKVFYAMAAVGFLSFALRTLQRKEKGEVHFGRKKHSHKHWVSIIWKPYINRFWRLLYDQYHVLTKTPLQKIWTPLFLWASNVIVDYAWKI